MARIKRASRSDTVPVFEDPRPSKNTVYLEHQAHDKTTLATKFGGTLRMRTSSSHEDFNNYGTGNFIKLQDSSMTAGRAGSSYLKKTAWLGKKQSSHLQGIHRPVKTKEDIQGRL